MRDECRLGGLDDAVLTCAAMAPLSFLRLAPERLAEGLALGLLEYPAGSEAWVPGVPEMSLILLLCGVLVAADRRSSSTETCLGLLALGT